ncbi:MAG: hypothetical protein AAGD11_11035 [Planctomycetota bacterium]
MSRFLAIACLLSASLSIAAEVKAQEIDQVERRPEPAPLVLTPELIDAHREYQLAQLRWQKYRFQEQPRQRKLLDQQVGLAEAEIRVLRRRIRDYRPFLQVGRYSPARTAAENDRLALLATEQELRLLRDERINQMRYRRQTNQLYQLEVLRTAAKVLAVQRSQREPADAK